MEWTLKPFSALTAAELFEIYKNRVDVFVVEQNCPYHEVDDRDLTAQHLFAKQDGRLAAYCRLIDEPQAVRIGRVLVAPHARGQGLARALMAVALDEAGKQHPHKPVHIQAQLYLAQFYQSLGFQTASETYLEDGIPHVDMVLELS